MQTSQVLGAARARSRKFSLSKFVLPAVAGLTLLISQSATALVADNKINATQPTASANISTTETPSNKTIKGQSGNIQTCSAGLFHPSYCHPDACYYVCDAYSNCWYECDVDFCNIGWCGSTGGGGCFPRASYLKVQTNINGELGTTLKSFHDVRVGDVVEVSPNVFSPIMTFMHRDPAKKFDFTKLTTTESSLTLSSGHFLFRADAEQTQATIKNAAFVKAKDIMRGDHIFVSKNNHLVPVQITKIESVSDTGIYAPITKEGTLVVYPDMSNVGVMASCYSDFSHTELTSTYAGWKASIENAMGYTMDENTEYGTGVVSDTLSDLFRASEK